jgi:hypothetical protein
VLNVTATISEVPSPDEILTLLCLTLAELRSADRLLPPEQAEFVPVNRSFLHDNSSPISASDSLAGGRFPVRFE